MGKINQINRSALPPSVVTLAMPAGERNAFGVITVVLAPHEITTYLPKTCGDSFS